MTDFLNEQAFIHAPYCCTVAGRHVAKWHHPMAGVLHGSARVKWLPCVGETDFNEPLVRRWFTQKGLDVLACNLGVLNAKGNAVYAMDFVCEGDARDLLFFVLESNEPWSPCAQMRTHVSRIRKRILSLTRVKYECYILNVYAAGRIKCYCI